MTKEIPEHKDIIGNLIKVGDTVVSPNGTRLYVGVVEKINPKMINVKLVATSWRGTERRYPQELLVVNDPKVTLYLIQNSK